jgi:hypothetical protein
MGRRIKRRRILFDCSPWQLAQDRTGAWQLVNQRGGQPLREEEPLARLYNLKLAAAAPELRAALRELIHLARRLCHCYSTEWRRDGGIVARAEMALALARPSEAEVGAALRAIESRQLELELTAAVEYQARVRIA